MLTRATGTRPANPVCAKTFETSSRRLSRYEMSQAHERVTPIALAPGEGERFWFLGAAGADRLATICASRAPCG